jgi:dUTP pyrophosphatase
MIDVKIVNTSSHPLPSYQTVYSAGMDLCAFLSEPLVLHPLQRVLVPTGLFIELPVGYEAQIRPRSGLALKHGITVLNSPGTIDSDYRGEIKVILVNVSDSEFVLHDGDRICQLIVSKHESVQWVSVSELSDSVRGIGGFGHTGF